MVTLWYTQNIEVLTAQLERVNLSSRKLSLPTTDKH